MKNNIDEDIKMAKNLIKILDKTCENNNSESARTIERLLSELETYKKANDNLLIKNAELKQDVQDFQQALNDENLRCSFYAIENNDLKEKLEIQGNITETYKKIVDEKNKELNEENLRCSKLAVENNDLKEKLETSEKIAEYFAVKLYDLANEKMKEEYTTAQEYCEYAKLRDICVRDMIISARKEVEKNV